VSGVRPSHHESHVQTKIEGMAHRNCSRGRMPLQLAGFSTGPLKGYYQWLPALVYQIVLALWLLIKGVAPPSGE
jgi:hypothetical protein